MYTREEGGAFFTQSYSSGRTVGLQSLLFQVPSNRGMQACRLQVSRAVVGGSGSSDGQSGDSSFRVAELSASADSGHVEH